MLVIKERRITREARKAYGLPVFPGVSCEEKSEGIPVIRRKPIPWEFFVLRMEHTCKVEGRVQKMQIFSRDLHEQPRKPFRLPGMM